MRHRSRVGRWCGSRYPEAHSSRMGFPSIRRAQMKRLQPKCWSVRTGRLAQYVWYARTAQQKIRRLMKTARKAALSLLCALTLVGNSPGILAQTGSQDKGQQQQQTDRITVDRQVFTQVAGEGA